ncbi:NUDIX domain-containing protein [Candidatus Gottesmanbacteria bacterium]|nr:NUDIX domain-containing protein [Candidatus Gottesmanbacteria bacterium]
MENEHLPHQDRKIGVQVVIMYNGKYFVKKESDADGKLELNVFGEGGLPLEPANGRLVSVGGATEAGETLHNAAVREMEEEVGLGINDGLKGRLTLLTTKPLACYQFVETEENKKSKANLMGVYIAIYEPSSEEVIMLEKKGQFISFDNLLEKGEPFGRAKLYMRPTFRMALFVSKHFGDGDGKINNLIDTYNTRIVRDAGKHARSTDIDIFSEVFRDEMLPNVVLGDF